MSRRILLISALVMLLVALPMISIGSVRGATALWAAGLVVSAGGFVLPLALRFVPATQTVEDEPDVGEEPT